MGNKIPKIFVINPGSTSTKIALYNGMSCVFELTKQHNRKKLIAFGKIINQLEYREKVIKHELVCNGILLDSIDVFISRGGLMHPMPGGIYTVNQAMLKDLCSFKYGEHASNLGAVIACNMAAEAGKFAFIANPPIVDELSPIARLSGYPGIPRRSIFHALNQKAVAEKVSEKLHKPYERCNMIVAHVGGGVSIGVHKKGRVVDVNNALEGDGPFSPERTGGLPILDFYRYIMKKRLSSREVVSMVTRNGGLYSYLGTNDCQYIVSRIRSGNKKFRLVYEAFIYQIAKSIGASAAALSGNVDAIVLTGNVLRSDFFRKKLKKMVSFIAPVFVLARNSEMEALAKAGMDIFTGKKKAKIYRW